ncbi:hypothetical protein INT43_003308 [Umbelopsis isabellina]|uniref:Phosphoglucomutase n=1 Tax=Mortierella isabellina TaxID=91625 RepID=A0A8H7UCN2_MORIS|nr:hypothetical protein INT43_003308 [Umbelopsis isabellina]
MFEIEQYKKLVTEWLRLDQNPETRAQITALADKVEDNLPELKERLGSRIEFGTAGLRARMEAGFSRMNDLTVIQASQGLAKYLLENVQDAKNKGVVVGHDHRHHSQTFAKLTAAVFISLGFKVWFFRQLVHTPLVPYTVKKLGGAAGIMITASHNPKDDNGYKVYWENACQIIPPHDSGIAAMIEKNLEPWIWDEKLAIESPLSQDPAKEGVIENYFEELKGLSAFRFDNEASDLKFVYTAMHGVGTPYAKRSFEAFGLKPFIPVSRQVEPDPDFPTVAFPNPEEGKGALALAIECAEQNNARIIIANDPDADRLAIAEKQASGEWIVFTGNQIGTILGSATLERLKMAGEPTDKVAMLASTVSSKFLAKLAVANGFLFEETLTGFKWIGNRAQELENQGYNAVFAFEEAIGFTVGKVVRDKDGVSALGFFAEWAVQLYNRGQTAYDYLQSLYRQYGFFVTNNSYFICRNPQTIREIFFRIRYGGNAVKSSDGKYPYKLQYPENIGKYRVVGIRDLTVGYDSDTKDNTPTLPVSSSSEMITFKLDNGCVFTIRTSGTEPKIKYYCELAGSSAEEAANDLKVVVDAIGNELMEAQKNNLEFRKEA